MLKNTEILYRIAFSALLPLVAFAVLAIYDISMKWSVRSDIARMQPIAEGVGELSRLVHELQRERGLSSAFLSSKGAQMRTELMEQRKRTDAERTIALAALSSLRQSGAAELASAAQGSQDVLGQLDQRRADIDGLTIAPPTAVGYLTDAIGRLITVITGISKLSSDDDISKSIAAYANLIEGKERAGQERAAVAGGIAAGRFEPQLYVRAIGLAAAQEGFFSAFRAVASREARDLFANAMSGAAIDTFNGMRKTIEQGGLAGDFKSLGSKAWFEAATVRIDRLKTVEDGLAAEVSRLMANKKGDAQLSLGIVAGLMLIALLVGSIAVLVMARSITAPINTLASNMTRLAEGHLEQEVGATDRGDEIGVMARAVQFFKENMIRSAELAAKDAEAVNQRAARAARVGDLTSRFNDDIGAVIGSVISASSQLKATASLMSKSADKTSGQAASVAEATEEASSNMQTVAAATEELSGSVTEIGRQVVQSAQIAQRAAADGRRTNETVRGLSNAAERIGDVIKLISEIASQTNLLALNATIEAARAGNAGRGFAVVAAEVKTLAEQTAKATDDIRAQIGAIQATSSDVVTAIQGMIATIDEINEIASSIASAVEEQSAATQEIARNVQHAARGTGEISTNIVAVTGVANESGAAASQVLGASEELSRQSERMRNHVEAFISSIKAA
ncbi:methyl-accepting chemotaxis protein [Bradyrhizobium erythrophlei]|uniref:methyl-accepting chemotaxis protein n=1 Tax=Bradyrhizobium erythrophlei TaxID=1437360 RepID=UPI0035E99E3C